MLREPWDDFKVNFTGPVCETWLSETGGLCRHNTCWRIMSSPDVYWPYIPKSAAQLRKEEAENWSHAAGVQLKAGVAAADALARLLLDYSEIPELANSVRSAAEALSALGEKYYDVAGSFDAIIVARALQVGCQNLEDWSESVTSGVQRS